MSEFWHANAPDDWRLGALAIMREARRCRFQTLTKRLKNIAPFLDGAGVTLPPNFWADATIERGDFGHRIDTLHDMAAELRFLSIEPLIRPIGQLDLAGIHWVIVGGESGPGARHWQPRGFREIRDHYVGQHVPLFVKQ